MWFLEEGVRRLSNDRNFRVRHSAPYVERAKLIVKVVELRQIRIGDWIVFKTDPKEKKIAQKFLLGRVISLSLLKGTKKEMGKVLWYWEEGTKDVGVLCHWYIFEQKGKELTGNVDQIEVFSHRFYPCHNDTYICSIPPPHYENEQVKLPPHVVADLHKYVASLI